LSQLPDCGGYITFLYVSDKTNDATVNELINHIALKVRIVGYNKVLPVLHDLIDAKSAYEDILNKNIQEDIFGVPVQIRRNCDSVWLFAGMTDKIVFSIVMNQVGLNGKDWWEEYFDLNFRDVMIIIGGEAGSSEACGLLKKNFFRIVK
jgi:hypothetical protein